MDLVRSGFARLVGLALMGASTLCAARAEAQQVKPYFLVIFDTSGSMSDSTAAPSCPGYAATKIGTAKCVLTKLLGATGDAEFGLMQFAQTSCGNGPSCGPVAASAQLRVPIQTNSVRDVMALIDNTGASPGAELCSGGYTPLGGTLVAAKDYFSGNLNYQGGSGADPAPTANDMALSCRPLSVILMTDGVECCNSCDDSMSPWNIGCPKADPVLMAAGKGTCPKGASACGSWGGCDNDDAFESAPEKAYELLNETMVPSAGGMTPKQIPTYVVGFGIGAGDARIERIATAGGTDNPGDGAGGNRAFYASNESELALAFAQIINDAQPPQEICNNLDDDCDGAIDEGIPKFCNKPAGITDPLTCAGASDPTVCCMEPDETLCDNMDDDCDGLIDEGLRNACGQCESPPETCDAMDNDCDGVVDEDTASGEACGTDEGECQPGKLRCVAGSEQCEGEVGPQPETCNCKDDDCDGKIDEDPDNDLCPDGRCVACMCIPRCNTRVEFNPACDPGYRPDIQPDSGECLCIVDNCDPAECREQTLMRGDEVGCAPDDPSVAACACRAGECGARCDGVTCVDDKVCNPKTGRCVEDNCRGLGCGDDQLCDPIELECVEDECADAECEADQVCRGGKCERSCADTVCDEGQRCEAGKCVADLCAQRNCGDELCNPEDGECIEDECKGVVCDTGLRCAPASGECERDSCWNVHCPSGLRCVAGECLDTRPDAGSGSGRNGDPNVRLLAKGGGGCNCSVGPGTAQPSRPYGALALGLLGVALVLGRRRRARGLGLLVLLSALLGLGAGGGCKVSPFCVDCADGGRRPNGGSGGSGRAGNGGSAGSQEDGGIVPVDGEVPLDAETDGALPTCKDKQTEICDGKDNDCDFRVDEEVEADVNDCTQQGLCKGTQKQCTGGEFACRFPDEREDEETLCDGIDSDCDGRTDESFDGLGDGCEVGIGACKVAGVQVCGDNLTSLRCEVSQTVDPVDEICDGIDNDCDGLIDEPKSDPGTAPSYVQDAVVQVGASLWVYAYEASRPDATDSAQGLIAERACSRAGVLPWTNLTYAEAVAACQAADMELCTATQWLDACDGGGSCIWSYAPSGNTACLTNANNYPPDRGACNGHDMMAAAGTPDNDDLAATGAYERCFTFHASSGGVTGGQVYDLSGNAKEWTTGPGSPAKNPLRGGSYNNLPNGMRCDFDFAVAPPDVRLRNVGFRCCSTVAP